jgi:uncharacterized repeat protein (TIGR01451 family)
MTYSVRHALVLSYLVLAPALVAQIQPAPRAPLGIYVVVNVEQNINQQQPITPAALDAYFDTLYQSLLDDAAVSGLTLQVHWDTLNPNPPSGANAYFWNYVDDAFNQAAAWNAANPAQTPKTIQLIVTAGFQTPQWVLNEIPSCDGLFQSQTPPSTCGLATFTGYSEQGDGTQLPLPWNPVYKSAWQTFLTALAARYGSNPLFVSIAVAGPTAASAEMILPNDNNSNNPQTQFGANFDIAPNDMWRQLLLFQYPAQPAYQDTDQAFVDAWDAAIDMYGTIFSGLTLVATTGDGLPNLSSNYTILPAFTSYCGNPNMDCAAETAILSYFIEPSKGGANAKATQTSGMEASRVNGANLGVTGVKLLSQSTAQFTAPSAQILGGEQFNTSFSNDPLGEGCTSTFPPNASDTPAGCTIPPSCTGEGCLPIACIPSACLAPGVTLANLSSYTKFSQVPATDLIPPEQSEYNVLSVYFAGTAVAAQFGGTPGPTPPPLNYLQIYSPDIQYAEAHVSAPAQVVETGGTVSVTAQQLLNQASQAFAQIAEQTVSLQLPSLSITKKHSGVFTQGQQFATYTVTVSNGASGGPTSSTVTVTDTVPAGLTLVSMSGTGWDCSISGCTRGDVLNPGSSYPAIIVTVNVAANAASPQTNQASVSGGGSASASASDVTTVEPVGAPAVVSVVSPSVAVTGVPTNATLAWGPAAGAASYQVYFGIATSPLVLTTTGTSYTPPTMKDNTTYFWSVTAVNAAGSMSSAVFSFTTATKNGCSLSLPTVSATLPPTGTSTVETCPNGSGQPSCGVTPEVPLTLTVTPSAACGAWTAISSNPAFLQVTSGATGSGTGTVGFVLLNNTHNGQQSDTITVATATASATYIVTEAGSGNSEVYREVYALYEQLLGRDPDPAGFAFWSGSGGAGLGQMADSFLTSPEAFNSDFAVMAAYQGATGGAPTYAQFAAAVTSVRAGTQTVPGLFNSLIGSGYTSTTLYENLLNRQPTAADSSCTSMTLVNCFQAIIGFPSSTTPVGAANNEFQSTGIYHTTLAADHTNGLYVQMIYYVTLSRNPDASGLSFWTGIANDGGPGVLFDGSAGYPTRIQILGPGTPNQGFIGSSEFQGLFAN